MIKVIATLCTFLLLMGCDDNTKTSAPTKAAPLTPTSIKKQVNSMVKNNEEYAGKFANLYAYIKGVNSQLPKLNSHIQNQIKQQSNNISSQNKEMNTSAQQQFKQVQTGLNELGKALADAGY